jgi:hypothetical protein
MEAIILKICLWIGEKVLENFIAESIKKKFKTVKHKLKSKFR